MLQRIRDRISGWIAGVIIALVAGAFMLFGVEYYFDQNAVNQNQMAKVNGVVITDNQVNAASSQLQQQMQASGRPISQDMLQQIKDYALQSLVTQTALFTTLEKNGFRVSLTQVKMMVEQTPQFQNNGKFSEQKMLAALYQANLTPMAFFDHVQSQWIVSQAMGGVAASAFALPTEVAQAYRLQNQERSFGYFIIPMQSMLSKVNVTENDIKNDYAQNAATFETPAKVSVSYIELSPDTIAKKVTVTEQEAQQYYQEHLSNYQVPKRWVVSQITLPISEKQKADAVAAEFRENKNTGYTSSVITLNAMEIDPALHAVLSALSVNDVSKPLQTPNGYTILKLQKVLPEETHSFESVKNNLMQLLQHQKVNQQLTKESASLADLTYTNPDSLEVAAKTLDLPIQTSPMITKAGDKNANNGIFANPKVLAAIFSDSVFKSNNNSSPIDLGNGEQIVLRINKKIPSEPIPLSQVSAQIKTTLMTKQAEAKAGLLAYQLQKKIEAGAKPESLAKENGLQWHVVPMTTENAKSAVPEGILSAAFKTAGAKTTLFNKQDYAVILVNQIKNADAKNLPAQTQQKISQQLTALWSQLMQHCFVNSVIDHSKIVTSSKAAA